MLLISAFLISVVPSLVRASPLPNVSVKPASMVDIGLTPGTTFLINCSVDGINDLSAWQITLHFNPAVLNCTNAFYPADHVFAGKAFQTLAPAIDNSGGSVLHGCTLMGTATAFSGSGTLCQIQFQVKSIGQSGLNYSKPSTGDTIMLDSNLAPISITVQDGYFSNMPPTVPPVASFDYSPKPPLVSQTTTFNGSSSFDPDGTIISYDWNFGDGATASGVIVTHAYAAIGVYQVNLTVTDNDLRTDIIQKSIQVYSNRPAKLYVNPPQIIDPTLRPPAIITVNVTVADVQNMYDYFFKLNFDPSFLTCIGIMVTRVQGETHFTPRISIDDDIGIIKVNVTYYPPAIPITSADPLDLVTITFQLNSVGSSTLHLSETELSDPAGGMIAHEVQDGLIMVLIRDVAVTGVTPENSWVYTGLNLNVIVKVKNLGNISETFYVHALYDSNLIGTITVTNLTPDNENTLVFPWDTTGVGEGNYTISAKADPVPFEYNLTNNVLVDDKVTVLTHIRDVAITRVAPSRAWIYQGWLVNITVTAKNLGELDETFAVNCSYDGNIIGTHNVIGLNAGGALNITFTWNTSAITPCHNYTISAEATVVPFEYNTANNVLVDGTVKVRFMCDVNGDGKVDILDVSAVGKAFGSYPGDPTNRWNPDCDFNQDGKVNILDVSMVGKRFGTGC